MFGVSNYVGRLLVCRLSLGMMSKLQSSMLFRRLTELAHPWTRHCQRTPSPLCRAPSRLELRVRQSCVKTCIMSGTVIIWQPSELAPERWKPQGSWPNIWLKRHPFQDAGGCQTHRTGTGHSAAEPSIYSHTWALARNSRVS